MITSPDGSTPVSEPTQEEISVEKETVKHPDPDQLDPRSFRIDQSEMDQPVVKTALTAIAIRRPHPLEFIRTHPDPTYQEGPVRFINLKENREYYLVVPKLYRELRPREYSIGYIFLATNRMERPFFWIITTESATGRVLDWYTSALTCERLARTTWIQVVPDQSAGVYLAAPAEDSELLEEPVWPKQSFKELFNIGFKHRIVDNLDHPVFKQLRGRV